MIGSDELSSMNSVFAPFFQSEIRNAGAHTRVKIKCTGGIMAMNFLNIVTINIRTLFAHILCLFRGLAPYFMTAAGRVFVPVIFKY